VSPADVSNKTKVFSQNNHLNVERPGRKKWCKGR